MSRPLVSLNLKKSKSINGSPQTTKSRLDLGWKIQASEWPHWLALFQMSSAAGFGVASGSKMKWFKESKQKTILCLDDTLSRPGHQTWHSSNHETCKGKSIVNEFCFAKVFFVRKFASIRCVPACLRNSSVVPELSHQNIGTKREPRNIINHDVF